MQVDTHTVFEYQLRKPLLVEAKLLKEKYYKKDRGSA